MKVNTEELREAHRIIDFVPANPVLDSSLFVRIKQAADSLSLALTGSLWAQAAVKGSNGGTKWTAYVERRLLKAFLSTASGAEIEILYKEKQLILRSGQRLEEAHHAPISGYETWEPKATFDLTDDQHAALKTAVRFLPSSAGTENVDAVMFSNNLIFVTDTLTMMGITKSVMKRTFFMPPDVARFLASHSATSKIATDDAGTGVSLGTGFVFQPLNAALAKYPVDKCNTWIADGMAGDKLLTVKAAALLEALRISGAFIMDKTEAVTMAKSDTTNNLQISVGTSTGRFQRLVPVTGDNKMADVVKIPARKVMPWFELAVSTDKECEVTYSKLPKASVFRFKDGVRQHCLIIADM